MILPSIIHIADGENWVIDRNFFRPRLSMFHLNAVEDLCANKSPGDINLAGKLRENHPI